GQRRDAEVARDRGALGDEDRGEGDAVLPPPPLALELRFSRDVDPLLAFGARGRLEGLEHVVHVAFELLDRPEARRIDRRQIVARVLDLALLHVAPLEEVTVDGAVADAGERGRHAAQSVRRVAAELARAPEGQGLGAMVDILSGVLNGA